MGISAQPGFELTPVAQAGERSLEMLERIPVELKLAEDLANGRSAEDAFEIVEHDFWTDPCHFLRRACQRADYGSTLATPQGTELVVRLPLVVRAAEVSSVEQPPSSTPIAGQRILVVDDNVDAAESLGVLLRCLGAEVVTVHDGRAALEALRTEKPAAAVLDIGMPGMDGYELARRARATPDGEDITLIALTGWGNDEDRRRSREAGIDHHLVKPVDLHSLQDLLATRRVASDDLC